jgi:hypothetical protein
MGAGSLWPDCATIDYRVQALLIPRPVTHLSWTEVHFLLIIEDRVCYSTLVGKRALLVPSRLHYCDDSCFTSCLFPDFTKCPCVALLQGTKFLNNLYLMTVVTMILVAWGTRKLYVVVGNKFKVEKNMLLRGRYGVDMCGRWHMFMMAT